MKEFNFKATYILIILFIFSFFLLSIFSAPQENFVLNNFGFSGENLLEGKVWTLFTSAFFHGNVVHFLNSLFPLLLFGYFLERRISSKKALLIFLSGVVLGNIVFLVLNPLNEIVIGSTSGVLAIIGSFLIVEFRKHEFTLLGKLRLISLIMAILFLTGGGITSLTTTSSFLATKSRLAGIVIGLVIGFFVRKRGELKTRRTTSKLNLFLIFIGILGCVVIMPLTLLALVLAGIYFYYKKRSGKE